jgi:hypothetical protein
MNTTWKNRMNHRNCCNGSGEFRSATELDCEFMSIFPSGGDSGNSAPRSLSAGSAEGGF